MCQGKVPSLTSNGYCCDHRHLHDHDDYHHHIHDRDIHHHRHDLHLSLRPHIHPHIHCYTQAYPLNLIHVLNCRRHSRTPPLHAIPNPPPRFKIFIKVVRPP